jgi:hypothetical protein
MNVRWSVLLFACFAGGGCGADATTDTMAADSVVDVAPDTSSKDTGETAADTQEADQSDSGAQSDVPADAGPTVLTPEPDDEAAYIYDQTALRTFELELSPENMATLDADPAAEQYVPGKLIFEGVEYDNVGVRYKGSAGAWINCVEGSTPQSLWNFTGARTCAKLSLKVSFNKYDPEGRFYGLKKLLFHAMNSDSSLMRERLGYWVYRQMGVAAPRAVHARVTINGARTGIYANVEYIDGRFTRSRFSDGKGNLYKEVWPTWNAMTGELTEAKLLAGLRTNKDENPSVANVLAFSEAMQGASASRAAALKKWMDIPNIARFIAADRGIGADDGAFHYYCNQGGCNNHNFYVYEEEKGQKLWIIPWDLDNAFVVLDDAFKTPADQFLKVVDDWQDPSIPCQAHPGSAQWTPWQMPPGCDPLFMTYAEHHGDDYSAAADELLTGPFSAKIIAEKLDTWAAQIQDTVAEVHGLDDEHLPVETWMAGLDNLKGRIEVLRVQAAATKK